MNDRPEVLLTSAIHPDEHARLVRHATVVQATDARPETLRRAAATAHGIIVRNPLPADIFEHAPLLKAVVRHGVGLDMIPMEAAREFPVVVANVPNANTATVVEYCLGAMLHLRRPLTRMDSMLRANGWAGARSDGEGSGELTGATCGIVGVGAIGSRLAAVAHALDMRVLGLTRRPATLPPGVEAVDKTTLLREADVIVLCCPLTDETRGLIDEAALSIVKPGAILINVARGPVVDTAALIRALDDGRLAGAALDVHDVQPLPADAAILRSPTVLLTPHVAGSTAASMRRMSQGAVDEMLRILAGQEPINRV
ncbi:NAD(P)-dependent oxidoreductase [Bordetella sp. LUAb4]|uniref:NAD(P)-dependent oxidoreductase n=1 Tax=Bordetella sp. LUAb4 TaxID=2843195 RepID=UPI001E343ECD|nr:NAD(P)-dependent oxidoreductase [Bordetella sp. LUAb4]